MIVFYVIFLTFLGTIFSSTEASFPTEASVNNAIYGSLIYNSSVLPSAPGYGNEENYSMIYVDWNLKNYFEMIFPNQQVYTKANIDKLISYKGTQKELEVLQGCGYDVTQLSNAINKISVSEFDQETFFVGVRGIKRKDPKKTWTWQENFNNALVRIKKHSSVVNPNKVLFKIGFGVLVLDIISYSYLFPLVFSLDSVIDGLFNHADAKDKNPCACHEKQKSFSCAYLWLRTVVVPVIVTLIYYKLRSI